MIQHENLVFVLGIRVVPLERVWFAFYELAQTTLEKKIKKLELSEKYIALKDILHGVNYLHRQLKIVHLDLKVFSLCLSLTLGLAAQYSRLWKENSL